MTTLQVIDARIAKHQALIDELAALRAEVTATLPAVEAHDAPAIPPGNARPAPPTLAAREKPKATKPHQSEPRAGASGDEEKRLVLANTLLASGPLKLFALADRARIHQPKVSQLLKHSWFAKTGEKLGDPWTLTEAGRGATGSPPAGT